MTEKRTTLTLTQDDQDVIITVVRTSAVMESKRMRLITEAMDAEAANKKAGIETDPDVHNLQLVQYPNCMCCTTSVEGLPWPLPFDRFKDLDGALVSKWHSAAVKLNAHWYETEAGEQAEAKKAP